MTLDSQLFVGTIIWAKQIDRQLTLYMKRIEDVLGKGWELYTEGQKLESESKSFRRKLDTKLVRPLQKNELA
jgi:dynein heavy chain 1